MSIVEGHTQDVSVKLNAPDSILAGDSFEIAVQIFKGVNTNFARVLLELPPGFEVDSASSDSARYMEDGTTVKYIWDRMPVKRELIVKFKITPNENITGKQMIKGRFTYIVDEEKHEITIPDRLIEFVLPPDTLVAIQEPILTIDPSVPEKPMDISSATSNPGDTTENMEPKQTPATNEAAVIIEFRIQIAASAKEMNIGQLKARYNITDQIRIEKHNGLWKYTLGSYSLYDAAKAGLPICQNKNGVTGAFITAYQNELRISVGSAIKQTK